MEAEDIERVILTTWPRLYLDTGDILDIADGRADPAVVDDLTSVANDLGVILVLSLAHFQDILEVDQQSRDRISTALERFQLRAYVVKGPPEVELGATSGFDIVLSIAGNIRELNNASGTAPTLRTLQLANAMIHRAFVGHQQARALQPRRVSKAAVELGMRTMISLVLGWPSDSTENVLQYWQSERSLEVADWEREALLAQLDPFAILLTEIQRMPGLPEAWRTMVLDAFRASGNLSRDTPTPGQYVTGRLNGSNMFNVTRGPRPSDILDMSHVAHLPYVDVATCDRGAFAGIFRHLDSVQRPRVGQLFRNGRLCDVLEAVRRLPNARQALVERMVRDQLGPGSV